MRCLLNVVFDWFPYLVFALDLLGYSARRSTSTDLVVVLI